MLVNFWYNVVDVGPALNNVLQGNEGSHMEVRVVDW